MTERVVRPTVIETRDFPQETVSEQFSQSTTSITQGPTTTVVKEPIIVENVSTRVVEEVQPVIYRNIEQPVTIQYQQPISQPISYQTGPYQPMIPPQYSVQPYQTQPSNSSLQRGVNQPGLVTQTIYSPSEFHLRVIETRGLHFTGMHAEAVPSVEVKLKGLRHLLHSEKQTAGFRWDSNNPVWNQDFILHPTTTNDIIQVRVWDKRTLSEVYLGKALIPVSQYVNKGPVDTWLPLVEKRKSSASGEIHVVIRYGAPGPLQDIPRALAPGDKIMERTTITEVWGSGPPQTSYPPI